MRFLFENKQKQKSMSVLVCLLAVIFLSIGTLSCGSSDDDNGTTDPIELPPVVFLANKDVVGKIELYTTFNGGTEVVKISGTLAGSQVTNFQISPSGTQVAYRADLDTAGIYELYVVAVDGGASVKVSGALAPGTSVETDFSWSADSAYIAFRKKEDDTSGLELFTVEPDGTNYTRISGELDPGEMVIAFAWGPAGINESVVAYIADQDNATTFELYKSKFDGSDNFKASRPGIPGGDVTDFAWSPDGSHLAYLGNLTKLTAFDLYTVIVSTLADFIVTQPGGLLAGRAVTTFVWAPNSLWLAYVANQDSAVVKDLFATERDISGSNNVSLLPAGENAEADIAWSPDSTRIAYRAGETASAIFELFTRVPTLSSPINKVSGTLVAGGTVTSYAWAPNGSRIAYRADQEAVNVFELYTTAPTAPADDVKISATLTGGKDVEDDYAWSPDSSLVAYRADQDTVDVIKLYSATPTVTANNTVSGEIVAAGGYVRDFKWEQAGLGIAYRANQDVFAKIELYTSLPDGTDNTKISGTIVPPDGDVEEFDWVP